MTTGAAPPLVKAQLLFTGGEIVTLNPQQDRAEELAVADGRIVAIGTRAEVRKFCDGSTREVNLKGAVLLPSLRDHHLHLQAIGFALVNRERKEELFLDLSGAGSEADLVKRVADRAAQRPKGTWIVGSAWNENLWDTPQVPAHTALSAAVPDHPAFLVRIDSHSALVNDKALRAAGIARDTPNPYGGEIRRMPDGSPSGMLVERALEPVLDAIPLPADDVVRDATRAAARALAERGYTEVFDAGIMHFPGLVAMNSPMQRWLAILRDVDIAGELPLKVNVMIPAPSEMAERVLRGEPRQLSPRVRFTHLKLYADGAFGSRGALMHEPYSDDPANFGISRMAESEMLEFAGRALDVDLDVAIHAIGDSAVTRVLNVYEKLLGTRKNLAPRRLRLEHFSIATRADIERAARLGILIVAQPGFVWPMSDGSCMEDSRLGPERVKRAYAWRTLLDLGAQIAGSSDDYGLPPHALWNYFAATTRQNPEGVPRDGWHPFERLTPEESMVLFTRTAAPGGGWGCGHLAVGGPADLVVLSENPLRAPSRALRIKVLGTVFGGRWTVGAP